MNGTSLPRTSGILLHPTSLPSPYGIGDLGRSAYEFIDFLALAGASSDTHRIRRFPISEFLRFCRTASVDQSGLFAGTSTG